MRKRQIRIILVLIAFIFSSFFLVSILLAFVIHFYGQSGRKQSADAIVILAGPSYRADHAATLWRQGVAPYIVCNGGVVNDVTIAVQCAAYLLELGIPSSAIVLENSSLSTEEHALYLQPIMEEREWESIVIVSSDYHLFRSMLIFGQYGIHAYPSPAPKDDAIPEGYLGALFREVIATEWQIVKTVLGLRYTRVDEF